MVVASLVYCVGREEGPTEDCNSLLEAGPSRINLRVGGGERKEKEQQRRRRRRKMTRRTVVRGITCMQAITQVCGMCTLCVPVNQKWLTTWMCLSAGVVL